MSNRRESIYKAVTGKIGEYSIISLTMSVSDNAIPYISANIDPVYREGGGIDVFKFSLDPALSAYNEIKGKERSGKGMDVHVLLENEEGPDQELKLEGWVIAGVGLHISVSPIKYGVTVALVHPAFALMRGVIFTPGAETIRAENVDALQAEDNVMEGLLTGLKLLREGTDEPYYEAHALVDKAVEAIREHIVYVGGGGWPSEGFDTDGVKDCVRLALWDYITAVHGSTAWQWLVHRLCPDWGLHMRPTFWGQLEMRPVNYWYSEPEYTLPAGNFRHIELNEHSNLVRGVVILRGTSTQGGTGFWPSTDTVRVAETEYKGISYLDPNIKEGAVKQVTPPAWTQQLVAAWVDRNWSDDNVDTPNDLSGASQSTAERGAHVLEEVYTFFENTAAKQLFTEKHGAFDRIRMSGKLMFTDEEGEYLTAGTLWHIKDGKGGFSFIARAVTHTIDCNTATATTAVDGNYFRWGLEAPIAAASEHNHMYGGG